MRAAGTGIVHRQRHSDDGYVAHVMAARFADHLPLYRQEKIFAHTGPAAGGSTLEQWIGTCGVQLPSQVDAVR